MALVLVYYSVPLVKDKSGDVSVSDNYRAITITADNVVIGYKNN